jgi:hypothetical protein
MRSLKILWLIVISLLAHSAMAEQPPANTPSPFGSIQEQLDALEARTQALEANAPNSNVDGRTYCFDLSLLIMRGRAFNGTEELQRNVIKRTATFSGGLFSGALLSNVLNNQLDDGTVITGLGNPIDPLLATYTQTGSKVDVTFADGSTANWYVSKDGSTIHGSNISHSSFGPGGVVTVGFVRNWTFVETDPLDGCDAEDQ